MRCQRYQAVENGDVMILRGSWNQDYLEELEAFPAGEFSDQVDGTSGAYNKLATTKRVGGW